MRKKQQLDSKMKNEACLLCFNVKNKKGTEKNVDIAQFC